jgi:hypothetical protein
MNFKVSSSSNIEDNLIFAESIIEPEILKGQLKAKFSREISHYTKIFIVMKNRSLFSEHCKQSEL